MAESTVTGDVEQASGALEIVQVEVGLLANFCEVIGCPATGEAALVDPAFEVDRLLREAHARGWRVTTIFLTHTHDDHVAGLDEAAAAMLFVGTVQGMFMQTGSLRGDRSLRASARRVLPLLTAAVRAATPTD